MQPTYQTLLEHSRGNRRVVALTGAPIRTMYGQLKQRNDAKEQEGVKSQKTVQLTAAQACLSCRRSRRLELFGNCVINRIKERITNRRTQDDGKLNLIARHTLMSP